MQHQGSRAAERQRSSAGKKGGRSKTDRWAAEQAEQERSEASKALEQQKSIAAGQQCTKSSRPSIRTGQQGSRQGTRAANQGSRAHRQDSRAAGQQASIAAKQNTCENEFIDPFCDSHSNLRNFLTERVFEKNPKIEHLSDF